MLAFHLPAPSRAILSTGWEGKKGNKTEHMRERDGKRVEHGQTYFVNRFQCEPVAWKTWFNVVKEKNQFRRKKKK